MPVSASRVSRRSNLNRRGVRRVRGDARRKERLPVMALGLLGRLGEDGRKPVAPPVEAGEESGPIGQSVATKWSRPFFFHTMDLVGFAGMKVSAHHGDPLTSWRRRRLPG